MGVKLRILKYALCFYALSRLSVAGPSDLSDVTFRIVDQSRYTEVNKASLR